MVVVTMLIIEWNVIRSFDHLGGTDSELESQGQISQKKFTIIVGIGEIVSLEK